MTPSPQSELPPSCAPSGCQLAHKYVNVRNVKSVLMTFAGQLGLAVLHLTGRPLVITAGYADGCDLENEHAASIAVDFSLVEHSRTQQQVIALMAFDLSDKYHVCVGLRFDRTSRMLLHVSLRS